MSSESKRYEQVTRSILESLRAHLGTSDVRGEVSYKGKSGARWKIDASSYRRNDGGLVLVECRLKTTRSVEQGEMAEFAFKIQDIGPSEGLMVTSIGYQKGAKIVAESERIGQATLNPDATDSEYILEIAERLFRGLLISDHGRGADSISVYRTCSTCDVELVTQDCGRTYICPICANKR